MSKFFTSPAAANLYDLHRPRVHDIIHDWLAASGVKRKYSRAVDVACGTGHSSLPLLDLAEELVCLDGSEAMLRLARQKGLKAKHAYFEDLPLFGKFDLLSTCMAFHWFDTLEAVNSYKAASNPGAIWLIYNFGFSGHKSNTEFNDWLNDVYLARYPSPKRNSYSGVISRDDPELNLVSENKGILEIRLDDEELVNYFLTQSNVEAAVADGRDYDGVRGELLDAISDFMLDGKYSYGYSYEIFEYIGT